MRNTYVILETLSIFERFLIFEIFRASDDLTAINALYWKDDSAEIRRGIFWITLIFLLYHCTCVYVVYRFLKCASLYPSISLPVLY